jgi:hypothetical protein
MKSFVEFFETDLEKQVDELPDHAGLGKGYTDIRHVGMKVADGEVLRRPKMTKKALKAAPTEKLSLHNMKAAQSYLVKDKVKTHLRRPAEHVAHNKTDDPYTVLRHGGKDYLMNGHHRAASLLLRGHHEIHAKVFNGT